VLLGIDHEEPPPNIATAMPPVALHLLR
jgi:hypothetical protein